MDIREECIRKMYEHETCLSQEERERHIALAIANLKPIPKIKEVDIQSKIETNERSK